MTEKPPTHPPAQDKSNAYTVLIGLLILFSLGSIAASIPFFKQREKVLTREVQTNLSAIADLKAEQIVLWCKERKADAEMIAADPYLARQFEKFSRAPGDTATKTHLAGILEKHIRLKGYHTAALVDTAGHVLLHTSNMPYGNTVCTTQKVLFKTALSQHHVYLTDLHSGEDSGHTGIHLSLFAPLASPITGTVTGAVVLDIDPAEFLFPLIQSWPTPSTTAEVLLIRRDGDSVLFLNELRYRKNSALQLHMPLASPELPAARTLSGFKGAMEGKDYRGIAVLAVGREIPGTGWYMIAKMDTSEALAEVRLVFIRATIIITLLVLMMGLLVALYQRHRSSRIYKRLYLSEHERANLATTLSESEERFRRIFEDGMYGMAIVDKSFTFTNVNSAFCTMVGYTEEELTALTFADITHPDHRSGDIDKVKLVLEGGIPFYKTEKRYIRKDGGIVWGAVIITSLRDSNNTFQYFLAMVEDITDRKKTEDALISEKERLSVTLRSIGDAVIATDVTGRIVLMNKVAENLTGWDFTEAEGKMLSDVFVIVNELTRIPCENPVEKVLKTGSTVLLENHTVLIARNGREIIIADSGAPIKNNRSTTIGVVLVFRDNTEKQQTQAALQKAQQLESLGVLAGGIAHDFNNLLGGLFGYLDLARESIADDDPAARNLDKAFSVFGRAKDLTAQLLTFAKGGAPARKVRSIAPLVRETVQFALSGSSIRTEFDIGLDLWNCNIDEHQISQVLDNLVINARDAMPRGGVITVTAANISAENRLPAILAPGRYVHISVHDQGIGISPEHLPHIFDPFFTTKQKGSGLGLAVSYSIVSRHEGTIEVESQLGRGSTFHLYLPASDATGPDYQSPEREPDHRGEGKILIMDDEEYIRDIASSMLRSMGYETATATCGEEAVELFTEAIAGDKPFTLVLVDLTIPGGMGGRETKEELRKISADCRIVASSGYSDDPIIAHPVDYGFTGSIRKPYRRTELMQLLRKIG